MDMCQMDLEKAQTELDRGLFWFGDAIFPEQKHLLRMFKGEMTPEQRKINKLMSCGPRIGVEWGFGIIDGKWKRLLWKEVMKIDTNRPALLYLLATFLCNVHNTFDANQIQQAFGGPCPSTTEYITTTMDEAAAVNAL